MKNSLSVGALNRAKRKAMSAYRRGIRYYDQKIRRFNPAWKSENILQHVSDLMEMHGVLSYQPGDDNPSHPAFSYINSGDTYNLTLIFNHHTGRFFTGCIGDLIEKTEGMIADDFPLRYIK